MSRIKEMKLELSILRACSLQSKLENKKKTTSAKSPNKER